MVLTIESVAFYLGKAICHQMPERTFFIDGHYLPLCARCTGIYIGIFSSLLFLAVTKKFGSNQIPSINISIVLLLFLFPLIIDGFGSYLGLYSTNNVIRLLTGIMFGATLPIFVVPLVTRSMDEDRRVMTKFYHFFIPLLFSLLLAILINLELFPVTLIHIAFICILIIWVALLFFLLYKKIEINTLSIGLSIMSSLLVLTLLSYLHTLVTSIV